MSGFPKDAVGKQVVYRERPVILYNSQGYMGTLHLDPQVGFIVWPTCEFGLERIVGPNEIWPKAPEQCYIDKKDIPNI